MIQILTDIIVLALGIPAGLWIYSKIVERNDDD